MNGSGLTIDVTEVSVPVVVAFSDHIIGVSTGSWRVLIGDEVHSLKNGCSLSNGRGHTGLGTT